MGQIASRNPSESRRASLHGVEQDLHYQPPMRVIGEFQVSPECLPGEEEPQLQEIFDRVARDVPVDIEFIHARGMQMRGDLVVVLDAVSQLHRALHDLTRGDLRTSVHVTFRAPTGVVNDEASRDAAFDRRGL